jgi:hypothetical protein
MLTWDKYLVDIKPSSKYEKILLESKKIDSIDNIEEIEKIEKEYIDKINQIKELNGDDEKTEELLKLSSLDLLKEEYALVKLFSKYSLQQNDYDVKFLLKILNLLYVISNELAERIKQQKITHKKRKDRDIMRCSYKFCNFKSNCKYHYGKKKCNSDHFVHNMVSADLDNLIDFFQNKTEKEFTSNKEVIKSINTILYVISHMESELSDSCRYESEDKWKSFHL